MAFQQNDDTHYTVRKVGRKYRKKSIEKYKEKKCKNGEYIHYR